ncbi:MAG: hypothetical protein H6970_15625 [Gammaproteobacteria bacterium]|nr:hypothetical protein [Gammaproteobacteria bacterium]MCP5426474.1 hypothetical protein [Gammaproteobacteria bacterium]
MNTAKQDALDAIERLPKSADMDEIMYRLYVLDKIRKGRQAVAEGNTLSSEQLKREMEQW